MKKIIAREAKSSSTWEKSNVHPLLARIYSARGVLSPDEIEHSLRNLLSYESLLHIDRAVDCLWQALLGQHRVLIVGDFDVDGATSTVVAMRILRAFGFQNVSYLVPNRFEFGYGLTPEIVTVAARENPDLIITVDNGISSIAGAKIANQLGIKVLVTDHHLPGETLPDVVAIVNPSQENDCFLSKNLAGVGVIFYVMLALRAYLREQNWFADQKIDEPKMADFLDLVALGTVADVVVFDKNNRIFVEQGLKRIRQNICCVGIKALLEVTGRDCAAATTSDLGYIVAPRINAAGRLDDMSLGIECLLTDDITKALDIAKQLNALNDERKAIEVGMQQQVDRDLEELQLSGNDLPKGICLFDEKWHQGVVGILASRVKDKLHRPVVAFAKIDENTIKGSVRSIPGLHIRDLIESIAIKNPDLITKYGGHSMAAGLTMRKDNYAQFCQAFIDHLHCVLTDDDLHEVIYSDGELSPEYFNLDVARILRAAGPWGHGFPEPIFSSKFKVVQQKPVGKKHLKLALSVPGLDKPVEAIAFSVDTNIWPNYNCTEIFAVYRLDVNQYRNKENLQLIIEHIEEGCQLTTL